MERRPAEEFERVIKETYQELRLTEDACEVVKFILRMIS